VLALLLVAAPLPARAQDMIRPGAADTDDPRSGLGNPAVLPFTGTTLYFGYHSYRMGFLDGGLRCFAVSYQSPYWLPGGGVSAQWFTASAFSQGELALRYGHHLTSALSLGAQGSVVMRQLDTGAFRDYDAGDPLLAASSALGVSAGLGVLVYPSPVLALGLYAVHLNRPDLSLADGADPLPLEIHGEARFLGSDILPGIEFGVRDGRWSADLNAQTRPFMGFSLVGGAQMGSEADAEFYLGCRAAFSRPRSPTEFRVLFEQSRAAGALGEFASGDREVGVAVGLDRLIEVPAALEVGEIEARPVPIDIAPESRYFAYLEAESLSLVEKRVVRRIGPGVTQRELADLTWEEVGYIDSTCTEPPPRDEQTRPLDYLPEAGEISGLVTDSWRDGLDYLRALLEKGAANVDVVVDEGSEPRARAVADLLADSSAVHFRRATLPRARERVGRTPLLPIERWYCMSDSAIGFRIFSLTASPYVGEWQLLVINSARTLVWERAGRGFVPTRIDWDWRDRNGQVIPSDHYTYYLTWVDQYGQTRESKHYQFFVRKKLFSTEVEIRRAPFRLDLNQRRVQLRLASPSAGVALEFPVQAPAPGAEQDSVRTTDGG